MANAEATQKLGIRHPAVAIPFAIRHSLLSFVRHSAFGIRN
jgi:hypothetical protein